MYDTASELCNDLLEIYFDECKYLSDEIKSGDSTVKGD